MKSHFRHSSGGLKCEVWAIQETGNLEGVTSDTEEILVRTKTAGERKWISVITERQDDGA